MYVVFRSGMESALFFSLELCVRERRGSGNGPLHVLWYGKKDLPFYIYLEVG
jgi:hypothetical protein